jgi:hypothetical protein
VPVTAGVVVALVNVPVAASAAVGINTITAAIAPNFQNLFHPWFISLTSDLQGPHFGTPHSSHQPLGNWIMQPLKTSRSAPMPTRDEYTYSSGAP